MRGSSCRRHTWFTATFSGFKNGETLATSGVTGSPSLTTTAISTSPVSGSPYPITAATGSLAAANYTFGFANGQLTVTQGTTSTALTASNNAPAAGQSVTFTATVAAVAPSAGTPTGTVTFFNGSTALGTGTLASGTATFSTTTLLPGRYQITATYGGDGNFTDSNAAAVNIVVGTQNERFVGQAYLDLLGRPVDPTGLSVWVGLLNQGGSRTQVALGIESSTEFRTLQVQGLYQQFLGRAADPQGLTTFVTFLANGGTVERLQALLTGSPEYFQNRGGSTTNGFLDALYQDALAQAVDPTGRALFSQALAGGTTRTQVADAIFASPEYAQDLVQAIFQRYLHRAVDAVGLSAFTSLLQSGTRDEQIIASVVASDEYFGRL